MRPHTEWTVVIKSRGGGGVLGIEGTGREGGTAVLVGSYQALNTLFVPSQRALNSCSGLFMLWFLDMECYLFAFLCFPEDFFFLKMNLNCDTLSVNFLIVTDMTRNLVLTKQARLIIVVNSIVNESHFSK